MPYTFTVNRDDLTPYGEQFLSSLATVTEVFGLPGGERKYCIPDALVRACVLDVWRGHIHHTDMIDDYLQVSETAILVVEHWVDADTREDRPTLRVHEGTPEQIVAFMRSLETTALP